MVKKCVDISRNIIWNNKKAGSELMHGDVNKEMKGWEKGCEKRLIPMTFGKGYGMQDC